MRNTKINLIGSRLHVKRTCFSFHLPQLLLICVHRLTVCSSESSSCALAVESEILNSLGQTVHSSSEIIMKWMTERCLNHEWHDHNHWCLERYMCPDTPSSSSSSSEMRRSEAEHSGAACDDLWLYSPASALTDPLTWRYWFTVDFVQCD